MASKQFLCLLCLGLLVPYALASPMTNILGKKHTQLAILVVIGLDELVTGGALMAGLTGLLGVSASSSDNHACTGYSPKRGWSVGGWCRPFCYCHEISVPNGSCGRYRCCIPNN